MAEIVFPDADEGVHRILCGHRRARLERVGTLTLHVGKPDSEEEWLRRIGAARGILLGWGIPDAVLAHVPALEVIAFTGIGAASFVNLDLAAERGITVCNTPGYGDNAVAEHALALLLAAARHVPYLDAAMRDGRWLQSRAGFELNGKRLALVGFGGIAHRMAQMAGAMGMQVRAWTRNASPERARAAGIQFAPLEQLLAWADVVSVHVALTPGTEGLIDDRAISSMRAGAILINTARGAIIEESALVNALRTGHLRAAGLDVFNSEPLPPEHPLLGLDNVVLSPHVAYNTPEATAAIYDLAVDAVVAWFEGQPINVVTGP